MRPARGCPNRVFDHFFLAAGANAGRALAFERKCLKVFNYLPEYWFAERGLYSSRALEVYSSRSTRGFFTDGATSTFINIYFVLRTNIALHTLGDELM